MTRKNDKRTRLIEAADRLFHEKGFNMTTLANIAELADVPLGNVYYYFKSKDSIALAVLEVRSRAFQSLSERWERELNGGMDRLKAFVDYSIADGEDRARFGDALGSLCQELGKQGGSLAEATAKLMSSMMSWIERQFKQLDQGEKSSGMAANLIATLQGISLLTVTFKDPEYLNRQTDMLLGWLQDL